MHRSHPSHGSHLAAALLALCTCIGFVQAAEESAPIRDFENLADYSINSDYGDSAKLTLDADAPPQGKHGLRIAYSDVNKGWMNVRTPALLDPCVEAITVRIRRHSADPKTCMHIWLMEKDNDRWISKPINIAQLPAGWTTVRVPISEFSQFQPKVKKQLDHRAVDAILLGFNYGSCTVTLDDLNYVGEELKQKWKNAMHLRQSVIIDPKNTVVSNFLGFGGEWDPKFWTMGTFQNVGTDFTNEVTVTEHDWQLELKRLRWMRPPIVRVMMCLGWCYPDGKWNTDTAHMRSLYRYLDFCQAQNIEVILTEWGIKSTRWLGVPGYDQLDDPRYGQAIAKYLDHLVREKGYTCIKYFVLCNEPNWAWKDSFDGWRKGVLNVSKAIDDAGLGKQISFMGADSAMGLDFHRKAVDTLANTIDVWDIHNYADIKKLDRNEYEAWYHDFWDYVYRQDPRGKDKPRVVGELGVFSPGFSSSKNPLHLDYGYGLLITDHAIQAVRAGSSAALAWMFSDCSHRNFTWGMWGDKENGLKLKPWFYPWSLLCRYFPRGSSIIETIHEKAGLRTLAAITEDRKTLTIVLVNREKERNVTLVGKGLGKRSMAVYVYSREAAKNDKDGFPLPVAMETTDLDTGHEIALPPEGVVVLTTAE